MQNEKIRAIAARVARAHGRDPFSVAERGGIFVGFYPFHHLPGMYGMVGGIPLIALRRDLPPAEARAICAHELGHHYLHREIARGGFFREGLAPGGAGRLEREADLFAAELLIPDADLRPLLACGVSPADAAEELFVPLSLFAAKMDAFADRAAARGK